MSAKNIIWSDRRCIEIASRDSFQSLAKNTNVQRSIISRFLNFYLSGVVPKGQTVTDMVFSVLSIMPFHSTEESLNETFIWEDWHYSEKGTLFFLSPDQKLQYDINMIRRKNEAPIKEVIEIKEQLKNYKNHEEISNVQINNSNKLDDENKSLQKDVLIDETGVNQEEAITMETSNTYENILAAGKTGEPSSSDNEINWFRRKQSTTTSNQCNLQYGPAENNDFCRSCNELLNDWSNIKSRISLKYFFGVVGLVLMRTRVKSFHNINKYFANKFHTICSVENICYSPPNQTCIKKCWKAFKKIAPNAQTVYAKIVINSFYIDKINFSTGLKKNIFKMAILAHAANFGMGIISMLQEIASRDIDFALAFKILQINETKDVMSKVKYYIDMFLRNKEENTHHWSRVIEIEQFSYLCCKSNPDLAVILAAFIEKLNSYPTDIWKSTWIDQPVLKDRVDSLKEIGYALYEKYKSSLDDQKNEYLDFPLCVKSLS